MRYAGKFRDVMILANTLRQNTIRMVCKANSGHIAGPLGMADVFAALYYDKLNVNPRKHDDPERDYLVVSNGHICPVLYAAMAWKGFFPKGELLTFRKTGSRLQGHPHREALPGLETSSGPLGSGLSQATGMALALKNDRKPNRVVCITSDGEHQEGNTWEAIMLAEKYGLGNLTVIIDRNKIQIDGHTEEIMPLKSLREKYASFHWGVIEINGNSLEEIYGALEKAWKPRKHPLAIIAHTTPGKGVKFMENKYEWHGKPPSEEEALKALEELNVERNKLL